jgi:hypothetical protein
MHNLLHLDTKHYSVAGDLHPVREQHVPPLTICARRTISTSIVRCRHAHLRQRHEEHAA